MTFVPVISDYDYADMGLLDVGVSSDLGFGIDIPPITLPNLPDPPTLPTVPRLITASEYAKKMLQASGMPRDVLMRKLLEAYKKAPTPFHKKILGLQLRALRGDSLSIVDRSALTGQVNFGDKWKEQFSNAVDMANDAVKKAKEVAGDVAETTAEGTKNVKDALNDAGDVINDIKEKGIAEVAQETMKKLGDTITDKAKLILDQASKAAGALKDTLMKKFNDLKTQAEKAYNAAKAAAAKIQALATKIANSVAELKNKLAAGIKTLTGKMADMAKDIGSKIAGVAKAVASKVMEAKRAIENKIRSAVANLKGDINALKGAVLGQMTQMKAQLTSMVNAGFNKLRTEMSNMTKAMTAKIAALQRYVGKVIADQGKKLAQMAAQANKNFVELRTGQKDIIAQTRELVDAKGDNIINQVNQNFTHTKNRFNHLDTSLNRANQERNIIRNELVSTKGSIMKQQERDKIILSAKIRGAEAKLTKQVKETTNFTKAGIAVSIASVLALAVIM